MAKLSPAQTMLLEEIREAGTLYVRRYGRYGRTVSVLLDRGLVEKHEPDYSTYGNDGYRVVPEKPWMRRTVTLTADGHEPFTHTSKSQSEDWEGAARLCAEVWMLAHPERRAAKNISVVLDSEEVAS